MSCLHLPSSLMPPPSTRSWNGSERRSTRQRRQSNEPRMAAKCCRRMLMKPSIVFALAAGGSIGPSAPAKSQDLDGTLKKERESGVITIGHRDSSIPLSYLDEKLQPVGFSIELCKHVVEAVKAKLGLANLNVKYNPVTSATRIPLVANGTVDIECGSTANMSARQKQ